MAEVRRIGFFVKDFIEKVHVGRLGWITLLVVLTLSSLTLSLTNALQTNAVQLNGTTSIIQSSPLSTHLYAKMAFLLAICSVISAAPSSKQIEAQNPFEEIVSPIPGMCRKLFVQKGDFVTKGTPLCEIEMMKMINTMYAPKSGKIAEIFLSVGKEVACGMLLIRIEQMERDLQ